jgi:hypothetical protein
MHPLKRFLVIVRAGDRSLHPMWTESEQTRTWDLVVSYYGEDAARYRNPGERRIDDRGPKLPGLHALLARETFWRDYDYVWLPDDDLAVNEAGVNRLFEQASSRRLELAQPALSWISFYSHDLTLRSPSFRLRYTNFVEIMAPCFSRDFLATCLPTFAENRSGWGLDYLWPRLLPGGQRLCAILDEVQITHTRPVGGPNYVWYQFRLQVAAAELFDSLGEVAVAVASHLGLLDEARLIEEPRGRFGNHLFGTFARDFRTSDGRFLIVLALTPRQWRSLAEATGLPFDRIGADLTDEGERWRHREEICALLEPWVAARSQREVAETFERHQVLWGPYRTFKELLAEEPLASAPAASPLRFDDHKRAPAPAAPVLGGDTEEVLREAGEDVEKLRREGTIA